VQSIAITLSAAAPPRAPTPRPPFELGGASPLGSGQKIAIFFSIFIKLKNSIKSRYFVQLNIAVFAILIATFVIFSRFIVFFAMKMKRI